jgi:hypothetical protein
MIENAAKPMSAISPKDKIEATVKRAKNRGRRGASTQMGNASATVSVVPVKQNREVINQ